MKIAKALKLKNRLAGELAKLKSIVQSRNVTVKGQEVTYDVADIVNNRLPVLIKDLVAVKTAIACANASPIAQVSGIRLDNIEATPYWNIFLMAELKGVIEMFKSVDTRNGSFTEFHGIRDNASVVEYVAQVKQADVDRLVSEMEKRIDQLQDDLDCYNASADIAAIDGISVR